MKIAYIDNFLSPEELDQCLEFYDFIDKNNKWDKDMIDPFWDDRTFEISNFMDREGDREKYKLFIKILKRMRDAIIKEFNLTETIHAETMQFVKWEDGREQLPHADNANPDGSTHHTPWRLYSGIIYLNDNYEGGQTYFPVFDYEIEPKAGRMGMFRGDLEYSHGVRPIKNGERKTIITFWCHKLVTKSLRLG